MWFPGKSGLVNLDHIVQIKFDGRGTSLIAIDRRDRQFTLVSYDDEFSAQAAMIALMAHLPMFDGKLLTKDGLAALVDEVKRFQDRQ